MDNLSLREAFVFAKTSEFSRLFGSLCVPPSNLFDKHIISDTLLYLVRSALVSPHATLIMNSFCLLLLAIPVALLLRY